MLARFARRDPRRQSLEEGQNRPRGTGQRLTSKEVVGYPLSGWRGTEARHPLRYTPRRAAVALPPRDLMRVRPHASVIASNRSRKGNNVLCPPGTCAFLGAFLCASAALSASTQLRRIRAVWITGRNAAFLAACCSLVRSVRCDSSPAAIVRNRASDSCRCLQCARRDCAIFSAHSHAFSALRDSAHGSSCRSPTRRSLLPYLEPIGILRRHDEATTTRIPIS